MILPSRIVNQGVQALHILFSREMSKAFIFIILLLHWQTFFDLSKSAEYDVVEYYAGVGRIARLSASCGLKAGVFDVNFDKAKITDAWPDSPTSKDRLRKLQSKKQTAMDLTTAPGFALLGFPSRPNLSNIEPAFFRTLYWRPSVLKFPQVSIVHGSTGAT